MNIRWITELHWFLFTR